MAQFALLLPVCGVVLEGSVQTVRGTLWHWPTYVEASPCGGLRDDLGYFESFYFRCCVM